MLFIMLIITFLTGQINFNVFVLLNFLIDVSSKIHNVL